MSYKPRSLFRILEDIQRNELLLPHKHLLVLEFAKSPDSLIFDEAVFNKFRQERRHAIWRIAKGVVDPEAPPAADAPSALEEPALVVAAVLAIPAAGQPSLSPSPIIMN